MIIKLPKPRNKRKAYKKMIDTVAGIIDLMVLDFSQEATDIAEQNSELEDDNCPFRTLPYSPVRFNSFLFFFFFYSTKD